MEPVLDGKSGPRDCLGELSFFFGMRQMYTARTSQPTACFVLERSVFLQLLKMYPDEEDTIASNALTTYNKVWMRAGSQSAGSAKSGASSGSAKSVQETLDDIMGGSLKQTINVLRKRRKIEAIEKAMKLAARSDIPELRKRFANGISANDTNHDGRTCLHIAASYGHVELAKFLIDEMSADVSIIDTYGNTPLQDAGMIPCATLVSHCCLPAAIGLLHEGKSTSGELSVISVLSDSCVHSAAQAGRSSGSPSGTWLPAQDESLRCCNHSLRSSQGWRS